MSVKDKIIGMMRKWQILFLHGEKLGHDRLEIACPFGSQDATVGFM